MCRRLPAAVRLATMALPVFLLTGCGGDGVDVPDTASGYPVQENASPLVSVVEDEPSRHDEQFQEAVRDLALVDPAQDVRLDVASAEFGLLSTEQLNIALLDENPAVRQTAIDALLGESESVVLERLALLELAMTDPDESVRESVVAVLGGSNDPRAIALLLKARGDESAVVREEAREALAGLRTVPERKDHNSPQSGD